MVLETVSEIILMVSKTLPYYTDNSDNSVPIQDHFIISFFSSFQINDNDKHRDR